METSTTSSDFGKSISTETTGNNEKNNYSTWLYILIVLALFGFLYFILAKSSETEHMSPGVVDQLFSLDSQDKYLSGGDHGASDIIGTSQFQLYWNDPTRVTNNRNVRGQVISTIPQIKPSKSGLVPLNTPGNLNSIENTVFPRVIPQSTVSTYPYIDNILINQKEDNDLMERQMSKQDLTNGLTSRKNTLRAGATNTLQNALVNSCQYCIPGKCQGCPMCLNGLTSHPKADDVASNKVDAKSVGEISDESEYMTLENFDSGLTGQVMPSRVHNKLKRRICKRQENFDSGLMNQNIPSKVHNNVSNKLLNKHSVFASSDDEGIENYKVINQDIENFDSGLTSSCMPIKVQKKILKKINRKQENFSNGDDKDNDIIYFVDEVNDGNEKLVNNPLRANTNGCANCPQGRCVNCPKNNCSNSLECPLGYPCKTCEVQDYLNSRTTLDDTENFANMNNQRENFDCPCRRKVITATNLNQKNFPMENFSSNDIVKKKGVKDFLRDEPIIDDRDLFNVIDNKSNLENFQCSLNPDSTECTGCVNMCPCRFGNCRNCNGCKNGNCSSCPNRRCSCSMGRCQDCPACKQGNCPMCPKNKQNVTENFESVGFSRLCPCKNGSCTNCPLCRAGKCPNCPKVKPTSTYIDLGSFGTWHGGSRLGTNWNDATDAPNPVDVGNGITFFPDSYVGSYFTNPFFDISYPYAVIPPSRTVAGLNVDF
jgi:hypothetical protein